MEISFIVYTVGELNFAIGGNSRRLARDADSPAPTTAMIQSIEEQVCSCLLTLDLRGNFREHISVQFSLYWCRWYSDCLPSENEISPIIEFNIENLFQT